MLTGSGTVWLDDAVLETPRTALMQPDRRARRIRPEE